jgi:hypothetical protein
MVPTTYSENNKDLNIIVKRHKNHLCNCQQKHKMKH